MCKAACQNKQRQKCYHTRISFWIEKPGNFADITTGSVTVDAKYRNRTFTAGTIINGNMYLVAPTGHNTNKANTFADRTINLANKTSYVKSKTKLYFQYSRLGHRQVQRHINHICLYSALFNKPCQCITMHTQMSRNFILSTAIA